jgi:hypothetical protein
MLGYLVESVTPSFSPSVRDNFSDTVISVSTSLDACMPTCLITYVAYPSCESISSSLDFFTSIPRK